MSFFGRFLEWQNYAHYALLAFGLGLVLHNYIGITLSFRIFMHLFIGGIIVDSLVHGLFWMLPKPLRWRD